MRLPTGQEINNYIANHPIVVRVLKWSKTHSMPGFYRIPFYDVISFIIKEFQRQDVTTRANSMAFSFFLAIFPSLIVLFTLIPFFPIFSNFQDTLYLQIKQIMPNEAGEALFNRIRDIATRERGGLLSLSFFLAVFFSSNGMLAAMRGFEKSYQETFIRRTVWQKQLVAIKLTLLLGALLIGSVAFIVLGNYLRQLLLEFISKDFFTILGFSLIQWLAVIILIYLGVAFIYRYGVSARKRWNLFSPGATLATVLSIIASLGFSFYVDNFGSYNELYGPIGAIIVLMLWIQINSFSLLIGFELNASIAVNRDIRYKKKKEPEDATEMDK